MDFMVNFCVKINRNFESNFPQVKHLLLIGEKKKESTLEPSFLNPLQNPFDLLSQEEQYISLRHVVNSVFPVTTLGSFQKPN